MDNEVNMNEFFQKNMVGKEIRFEVQVDRQGHMGVCMPYLFVHSVQETTAASEFNYQIIINETIMVNFDYAHLFVDCPKGIALIAKGKEIVYIYLPENDIWVR